MAMTTLRFANQLCSAHVAREDSNCLRALDDASGARSAALRGCAWSSPRDRSDFCNAAVEPQSMADTSPGSELRIAVKQCPSLTDHISGVTGGNMNCVLLNQLARGRGPPLITLDEKSSEPCQQTQGRARAAASIACARATVFAVRGRTPYKYHI